VTWTSPSPLRITFHRGKGGRKKGIECQLYIQPASVAPWDPAPDVLAVTFGRSRRAQSQSSILYTVFPSPLMEGASKSVGLASGDCTNRDDILAQTRIGLLSNGVRSNGREAVFRAQESATRQTFTGRHLDSEVVGSTKNYIWGRLLDSLFFLNVVFDTASEFREC
jgi:hypothetical protein